MDKLTYSIPEVAELLGISKSYAYEMVKLKKIPTLKIGKRRVVPKEILEYWIMANVDMG